MVLKSLPSSDISIGHRRSESEWSKVLKKMYEQDAKSKSRGKQPKEGVADYAEVASVHGINYIFERNVVPISR